IVGFASDREAGAGENVPQGIAHEERIVDDQYAPLGHRFTPPPGCRWPAATAPDRSASPAPPRCPPGRWPRPAAPAGRAPPRAAPPPREASCPSLPADHPPPPPFRPAKPPPFPPPPAGPPRGARRGPRAQKAPPPPPGCS